MQEFPETVPGTVSALLELYSVTAPSAMRSGVALALKACCNELEPEHVQRCLEFMLAQGLADADGQIWEQMVSAGRRSQNVNSACHLLELILPQLASISLSCDLYALVVHQV